MKKYRINKKSSVVHLEKEQQRISELIKTQQKKKIYMIQRSWSYLFPLKLRHINLNTHININTCKKI